MARSYKRDSRGRFAGGGGGSGGGRKSGGGGKGNVAARKAAVVKKVSSNALAGRKNTSTSRSYVRAQQGEKVAMGSRGKGNKAARRAAEVMARSAQATRSKQFSSKSAKNTAARAKYKAASGRAREAAGLLKQVQAVQRLRDGSTKAPAKSIVRAAASAKAALTRISNNLSGKAKPRKPRKRSR